MFPFDVMENAVEKGTILIMFLNYMAGMTFVNAQEHHGQMGIKILWSCGIGLHFFFIFHHFQKSLF